MHFWKSLGNVAFAKSKTLPCETGGVWSWVGRPGTLWETSNPSLVQQHNVNIYKRTGQQGAVNREELKESNVWHEMYLQLTHEMAEDTWAAMLSRHVNDYME